jgi:hypothetical protein
LIVDLDGTLIELYSRKDRGENVDLPIRNKEDQKRRYEKSRDELIDTIEKEKNLTMSTPVFLGIVRVKPIAHVDDAMKSDPEIEHRGMEVVMRYEKDAGRTPEDVSKENLGFDIRSKDSTGNFRYIEVKARSKVGSVALTQNEWFKAQRLGNDFYLYVVWNAANENASPRIIQNPALNLTVQERVEVVRYVINSDEIGKKSGI